MNDPVAGMMPRSEVVEVMLLQGILANPNTQFGPGEFDADWAIACAKLVASKLIASFAPPQNSHVDEDDD